METRGTRVCVYACALLALIFSWSASFSQAPLYKFKNPTLISGTANQAGATYRFPLVNTGVDALVKIQAISGSITLDNIDRTADGYSEAFQPEYTVGANSNAYIEFRITFVITATNTSLLQPQVDATGIDIDGYDYNGVKLKEMNMIDMGGGTYTYNTFYSEVSIATNGTAFTATNTTGTLYGALVDTASTAVMMTVMASNVTTFTYRAGANNQLPVSQGRYASLYFKRFNYPAYALSLPTLTNFRGNMSNQVVNLNWSFSTTEGMSECILEKHTGHSDGYQPVAYYLFTGDRHAQPKQQFSDPIPAGNIYDYRLKMIGVDGKVKYSSILVFQNIHTVENTLHVFPTIAKSQFTAQINAEKNTSAVISIIDYSGRVVDQRNALLERGQNNIDVNNIRAARGNYIVSIKMDDEVFSKKIILD